MLEEKESKRQKNGKHNCQFGAMTFLAVTLRIAAEDRNQ